MEWLNFLLIIWTSSRRVENYHQWFALYHPDRFDELPCRDCDVSEGMGW